MHAGGVSGPSGACACVRVSDTRHANKMVPHVRYVDIAVRLANTSREQKALIRERIRRLAAAKLYYTSETVSAWAELLLRIARPRQ